MPYDNDDDEPELDYETREQIEALKSLGLSDEGLLDGIGRCDPEALKNLRRLAEAAGPWHWDRDKNLTADVKTKAFRRVAARAVLALARMVEDLSVQQESTLGREGRAETRANVAEANARDVQAKLTAQLEGAAIAGKEKELLAEVKRLRGRVAELEKDAGDSRVAGRATED